MDNHATMICEDNGVGMPELKNNEQQGVLDLHLQKKDFR